MKVDITSLIIGIFALAIFCVPIAWYQISEKIKVKKLGKALKELAQKEDLTLTSTEVWGGDHALGVDREHKKLLYFNHNKSGDQKKIIDLSEVDQCKVTNGSSKVGTNGNNRSASNINLWFHYYNSKKGSTSLEIYDSANGKTLTSEMSVANKLVRSIRPLINEAKTAHHLPLI